MSLGIIMKSPEGLVLAAESRLTLMGSVPVTFDHATKVLSFRPPHTHMGAVTYGQAAIGLRTANSLLPELEAVLPPQRAPVDQFAQSLEQFFTQQWHASMPLPYQGSNMEFVVAGFDEGAPYGRIFTLGVPNRPMAEIYPGATFGFIWGGQQEYVDRVVKGVDTRFIEAISNDPTLSDPQKQSLLAHVPQLEMPIPFEAMPLQDCVHLAIFLIRTTIAAQKLTVGVRGCGGHIDVAIITRSGALKFLQQKELRGENEGAS